jgi:dATP/dGTP pyrophosphohydrolase
MGYTIIDNGDLSLRRFIQEQRQFSLATFGPGTRSKGVVQHIRKELAEIEADPTELSEWIDVVILALDGAWRAGFAPEQICEALQAKLEKNKAREWPDWRTMTEDQAIEHVR